MSPVRAGLGVVFLDFAIDSAEKLGTVSRPRFLGMEDAGKEGDGKSMPWSGVEIMKDRLSPSLAVVKGELERMGSGKLLDPSCGELLDLSCGV